MQTRQSVTEVLHHGRTHVVYRGYHPAFGPVVVKSCVDGGAASDARASFRREMDLTQPLPEGASALAVEEWDGAPALLMRDIGGDSLERIVRRASCSIEEALHVARACVRALGAIHGAGLVHRAVCPSHVVFSEAAGRAMLVDFCQAARAEDPSSPVPEALDRAELAYLAPELTGRVPYPVDHRADLYGLGATLFFLLTGRPPFADTDPVALQHALLAVAPPPLRTLRADVPEDLEVIVQRLLEKDPDARYQSVAGVGHDLELCQEGLAAGGRAVWVAGAADAPARFTLPNAVIGRTVARRALRAHLLRSLEGAPRLVALVGAAGVGKTALVQSLRATLAERRGALARGKFDAIANPSPYAAIRQALTEVALDVVSRLQRDREALGESLRRALGDVAGVVAEMVPAMAHVLGVADPPPPLGPVEAQHRLVFAFVTFVRELCAAGPVALFLDDLQWADAASLHLLRALLRTREIRGLAVIVAARATDDDGLSGGLQDLVAQLEAEGVGSDVTTLSPLDRDAVTELVAAVVHAPRAEVESLAAEVWIRSKGNPLFATQFLRAVHGAGGLRFDRARGVWAWNLAVIREAPVTGDVVEFLRRRLDELPRETRALMALAATLGAQPPIDVVARAAGIATDAARRALAPALDAGLLTGHEARPAVTETPRESGSALRFAHDRIQEEAAALIAVGERPAVRLQIGRLLVDAGAADAGGERLFDAVQHLNAGRALVLDPDERRQHAALNLRAGEFARSAAAFVDARACFDAGLALLDGGAPDDLRLRLTHAAAEAALLVADYDGLQRLLDGAQASLRTANERARFLMLEVRACSARLEPLRSLERAFAACALLGFDIPLRPRKDQVVRALLSCRRAVARHPPEGLLSRPAEGDADVILAGHILSHVTGAAYIASPDVWLMVALTLVEITVRADVTPVSAMALSLYALSQVAVGDLDAARRFGDLAARLSARQECREYGPRTAFVLGDFIRHWSEPHRNVLDGMREAFREARALGDPEWAGYSAVVWTFTAVMTGVPLAEVEAQASEFSAALRDNRVTLLMHDQWRQVVHGLTGRGRGHPWELDGETAFDERTPRELEAAKDLTSLCAYHINKLALCYWFDRDDEALRHADAAEALLGSLVGAPHVPYFHFYAALARIRVLPGAAGPRAAALARVTASLGRMAWWARHAPANYRHRETLIRAELQRVLGLPGTTALYARAIESAREAGFIHEEALAHTLAARAALARRREGAARMHLRRAWELWGAWGATALQEALANRHPWLRPEPAASGDVDTELIARAAQAISGEIEVDALVRRLMTTVLQVAGASRGALFLVDGGEVDLAARAEAVEGEVLVGEAARVDARVADGVVRWVAHSGESVVLGDATAGRFRAEPRFAHGAVRSVLCTPLRRERRMTGVIYLENNVARDAFTPSRVRVLELLAGQIAISLENARLYRDLRSALRAKEDLVTAQQRFVPEPFLAALGHNDIVGVALGDHTLKELTVLFSDVRGFSSIVERHTPAQNIAFINDYLGHVEPAIVAQGGFVDSYIGDAVMALFETGGDAAVRAAVQIFDGLRRFNAARAVRGEAPVRAGIGLSTGPLMLGTIGGSRHIKCGVIGDDVNLAARVESITRLYQANILLSDHTHARLSAPDDFALRRVDRVRVKGRDRAVTLWEVCDADDPALRDAKMRGRGRLSAAQDAFWAGDALAAIDGFEGCARACPDDPLPRIFLERAEALRRDGVPEGWDGVTRLSTK
jgi:predicted ATPase/class 3 adenylate cyclase